MVGCHSRWCDAIRTHPSRSASEEVIGSAQWRPLTVDRVVAAPSSFLTLGAQLPISAVAVNLRRKVRLTPQYSIYGFWSDIVMEQCSQVTTTLPMLRLAHRKTSSFFCASRTRSQRTGTPAACGAASNDKMYRLTALLTKATSDPDYSAIREIQRTTFRRVCRVAIRGCLVADLPRAYTPGDRRVPHFRLY